MSKLTQAVNMVSSSACSIKDMDVSGTGSLQSPEELLIVKVLCSPVAFEIKQHKFDDSVLKHFLKSVIGQYIFVKWPRYRRRGVSFEA